MSGWDQEYDMEQWKQSLDRWLTTPPEDQPQFAEDEEPERCNICGEHVGPNEEAAEMYPPHPPADDGERNMWYDHHDQGLSLYVHAQCGLSRGWEVS